MFQTILDTPFIVFDVETTGLDAFGEDRIVEIAAVKIINGKISEEKFEMLVNPERNIPIAVIQIHHITNEMVKDAPTMDMVWPKFKEFVGQNGILVAHNAEFDMNFIKAYCERVGIPLSELPEYVCTMKLSQNLYQGERFHNLKEVSRRLGVGREDSMSHRALYDTEVTSKCFLNMVEKSGFKKVMDLMF